MNIDEFDYKAYPVELKVFRATVLKAKMMQTQVQNNRKSHKWLTYTNSTRNRYNFATWLIHAFYSDRSVTAALLCTEMGISRKSIDEMVNDWEAEGWLYKEKGEGVHSQKYFLHPSQEVLHINDEWFQWYEDQVMPLVGNAFAFHTNSSINANSMKEKSSFNTTSNANLSGIDDNVTSFILDSSRKRRSEGTT